MFFMMGITDGRQDLEYSQMTVCGSCRRYGRYQVFMTYTLLSLFLIPCFKWNKRYYVQMSCCGSLYELDPEIGRAIARGERVEIQPAHLQRVQAGDYGAARHHCPRCGYETNEDFAYCPKCGTRF